jgi:hypothetical protein
VPFLPQALPLWHVFVFQLLTQLKDLVAQQGCFLEFQVGGCLFHLLFQLADEVTNLGLGQRLDAILDLGLGGYFDPVGQVLHHRTDVEMIPIFGRAGAIIPQLDPSPDTLLPATRVGVRSAGDALRVDAYPGADRRFRLVDGTEFAWDKVAQTLTVSGSPVARQVRRGGWGSIRTMGRWQ